MLHPLVLVRVARLRHAALCAILLAACDNVGRIGDGLADKPTPPITAREPLTPGSAGLAWAAPSSEDGSWVIGPQGIGMLMVGAAYPAGGSFVATSVQDAPCKALTPAGAPAGLVAWVWRGNIAALVASEPGPRLLGGIEVGTGEAELRRHFVGRLEKGAGADSAWLSEVRPETLSGYPVAFEVVDGYVRRIRVGNPSPGGDCR